MIEPWLVSENLLSPLNTKHGMFYAKSRRHSPRILAWISKLLKQILTCCQHNNVNKMTLHPRRWRGPTALRIISICDTISTNRLTAALKQIKMYELKNANATPTHFRKFFCCLNVCCNHCSCCEGQTQRHILLIFKTYWWYFFFPLTKKFV